MGGFGAVLYVCQYDTDPRTQDDNIFFFFPSLTFIFYRMIGIVFFFFLEINDWYVTYSFWVFGPHFFFSM